MPVASLLAVIDDIATVLDHVAVLTKVATKKTAGVLGDDLALNAEQVTGLRAERELPVVWAVAKGSLVNKAILVPLALGISAVAPVAITPLLVVGGLFLCFEGCEKLAHKLLHSAHETEAEQQRLLGAVADAEVDLVSFERGKIKGAIRTDFVLSAEIVVIALGIVAEQPFLEQLVALVVLSVLMTAGVYGLVAAIVKLDDLGQLLAERGRRGGGAASLQLRASFFILVAAPWLLKGLSVAGTVAMFLVGGGILAHALPGVEELAHELVPPAASGFAASAGALLIPALIDVLLGLLAGCVTLLSWTLVQRLLPRRPQPS